MYLCIHLGRQVVLQVYIRALSILDQTWHFRARSLCSVHAGLEQTDFCLKLCKVEVLILNHCSRLTLINAKIGNLSREFIHALRDFSLEVNHLPIVHASTFIDKALEARDLAPDFILHEHERSSLLSDFLNFFIDFSDLKDNFIVIFDGVFNV